MEYIDHTKTRKINKRLVTFFVIAVVMVSGLVATLQLVRQQQDIRQRAFIFDHTNEITSPDGTKVEVSTVSEQLDDQGRYTTSYLFKKPDSVASSTGEINVLIAIEKDRCPEGAGQTGSQSVRYPIPSTETGFCFTPWQEDEYQMITLNAENDFTHVLTTTTTQVNSVSCGSFQTDIWILSLNGSEQYTVRNTSNGDTNTNDNCPIQRDTGHELTYQGKTYSDACMIGAGGNYQTNKDLASCQVPETTPTPTPATCPAVAPNAVCQWDSEEQDGISYQYTISETNSGKVIKEGSLSASVSGKLSVPFVPVNGTEYTCNVVTVNDCGEEADGASDTGACGPGLTPTPTQPASSCPVEGASCEWGAAANAASYRYNIVEVGSEKTIKEGTLTSSQSTAGKFKVTFTPFPNKTYRCEVEPVNACGVGNQKTAVNTCTVPSVTPTLTPKSTPTPTVTPTPTPTSTPTPTPTRGPTPTTPARITQPPPVVVTKPPIVITNPPPVVVVTQPPPPGKVTATPIPTLPPTGTLGTTALLGAGTLILLLGGLAFFLL